MKCEKETMLLYAVTDRMWTGKQTLMEQVEDALKGGATCVQLREKELDEENFLKEAIEMKALCAKYGVPFIVNDNVEIAIKCKADGIHVGQSDMEAGNVRALVGEDMIIGVSTKNVEQALAAQKAGADYLGVGAMFHTGTKLDAEEVSREAAQEITAAVDIPVVAIGGINKKNILELKGTGVDGVALVSAIFGAENIEEECKTLKAFPRKWCRRKNLREQEKSLEEDSMKTALSIAGSDTSGGAGIQADLKTMTMNGVFAMSAITALTAQNTTGVQGIFEVTPEFLGMQIDSVFTDIRPDAVKIGMVSSVNLISVIAEKLTAYHAENIVVDPVMVATSGAKLISEDAVSALKEKLLPLATVVTPNIPEAEVLADMKITSPADMVTAAEIISKAYHCAVLCKGGHSMNDANDLLYDEKGAHWFRGKRIDNPNTHGTGCTLSSAIAANLAKGNDLETAVERAKEYISGALAAMLDLGAGSGPMNHAFDLKEEYTK